MQDFHPQCSGFLSVYRSALYIAPFRSLLKNFFTEGTELNSYVSYTTSHGLSLAAAFTVVSFHLFFCPVSCKLVFNLKA